MRERPILFNGDMVRAILDGRKTQTRRLLELPEGEYWSDVPEMAKQYLPKAFKSPYGCAGDRLWVREKLEVRAENISFSMPETGQTIDGVYYGMNSAQEYWWVYSSDKEPIDDWYSDWSYYKNKKDVCPSIHMPRWASRITLEITNVRVERVQEISLDDARAEGITEYLTEFTDKQCTESEADMWRNKTSIENFADLWNSIYKKKGNGWDVNPWVWVYEFKLVEK